MMKRMKREKILAYNIRTQEDIILNRTENLKVTRSLLCQCI